LPKCEKEIPLPDVKYRLVCHYQGMTCTLDTVTLDEPSLLKSYKIKEHLLDDSVPCISYEPMGRGIKGKYSCSNCTFIDTCIGGG
jgi:hypothetical protein